MIKRSDCKCACHHSDITHMAACCEPDESSRSPALLVCPVCDHEGLNEHLDPITHWGCESCKNIFITGADGTIGCFDTALYLGDEEN